MPSSWDPKNDATHRRKHGMPCSEALTIFERPCVEQFDAAHSDREDRLNTLERSKAKPDRLTSEAILSHLRLLAAGRPRPRRRAS